MVVTNMDDKRSCGFCTYSWTPIVATPKSCPRCKRRFDYEDAKSMIDRIGKEFGYDLGGEV